MSLHQAIILLLFNSYQVLSLSHIRDLTDLSETELRLCLATLALFKTQLLTKQTNQNVAKIQNDDVFAVNINFRSRFYRVVVNSLQIKETREETEQTRERVLHDRIY